MERDPAEELIDVRSSSDAFETFGLHTPVHHVAPAADRVLPVDELIETLGVPEILDALGITDDELAGARSDTDLLETLCITHEFLMALEASGVLNTFLKLRRKDQSNFLRWIGTTDDHQVRAERTATFVAALRGSPLGPGTRFEP